MFDLRPRFRVDGEGKILLDGSRRNSMAYNKVRVYYKASIVEFGFLMKRRKNCGSSNLLQIVQ